MDKALTEICEQLLDDYGLTLEQIANLAAQIPTECAAIEEGRSEAAWERQQERASSLVDEFHYRKQLREAGRGHLLR